MQIIYVRVIAEVTESWRQCRRGLLFKNALKLEPNSKGTYKNCCNFQRSRA